MSCGGHVLPTTQNDCKDSSPVQKGILICFGEYFGTIVIVFLSCISCTTGMHSAQSSMHGSLTGGLAVMTAIHIFGHVSGAHVNPAVTIAAMIVNKLSLSQAALYLTSQVAGSLTGYALVLVVTPKAHHVDGHCMTMPSGEVGLLQALTVEIILTVILVFAVCATWDRKCANSLDSVALRIGFIVTALGLAAGPYTGASMNPARSIGPAIWHHLYKDQWVYWVGPMIGGVLAGTFYRTVFLRHK